jgi:uncharacterized protein YgiM (DUF1202 family)
MKTIWMVALTLLLATAFGQQAQAQSRSNMINDCAGNAQNFFGDYEARTDTQYNGQRTDGTHAINGRIFLETRSADFACSYDRSGTRMVAFFVDGQPQNAYLPGGGSSPGTGGMATVKGIASSDVLNVRSGPGTGFGIVGALGNGDRVRNLGCEKRGSSTWCQIEMMTDMRERGWVNARYLNLGGGQATQLPSTPSDTATGERTQRIRFAAGSSGTEFRDELPPGGSVRYLLGAKSGQMLYLLVAAQRGSTAFRLLAPSGQTMDDSGQSGRDDYRGSFYRNGDHAIIVRNTGSGRAVFNVIIGIQ